MIIISYIKKLLATALLLCIASSAYATSITASVDRTSLSFNETLTLTVKVDKQGSTAPDFSSLNSQFDILNRRQSSQTSIINGRLSASTQWSLILAPKQTGNLIIPSFSINQSFSDAITIKVLDANSSNTQINQELFLRTSVSKNTIYVQEQLLFTVRLYYRISLSGYTPENFTIDNATMTEVSEKNFQSNENGVRYNILEKIYAIHPQANGTINLPSLTWQVEKSTNRFGFGQSQSPYLQVRSQAHSVEVLPIPTQSTANQSNDNQWLPATTLTIEPTWNQSPLTAKVGEPINLSLMIKADGLAYSQLPNLNLSIQDIFDKDEFTIYADQAKTEDSISEKGVKGSRIENYAIIPRKTGDFILPKLTLRWWNTKTNKEETITLAEQRIVVAKSALSNQSLPATDNIADTPSETSLNETKPSIIWPLLSILMTLCAVIFCILWLISKKHLRQLKLSKSTMETRNKDDLGLTKGKSKRINLVYDELQQAIDNNDLASVKSLLAQWATLKTNTSITTSENIKQYFPGLNKVISEIDKSLYNPTVTDNKVIDLSKLIEYLKKQTFKPEKPQPNIKQLESLYKT